MPLEKRIKLAKESCIFKMYYGEKPIGFRVKLFNLETCVFDYYDFTLETISSNTNAVRFLKSINEKYELKTLQLVARGTDLVSEDELNESIRVQEFKDAYNATNVLRQIQLIYLELEKCESNRDC